MEAFATGFVTQKMKLNDISEQFFTLLEMFCTRPLYCTHLYLVLDFSEVLQLVAKASPQTSKNNTSSLLFTRRKDFVEALFS